MTRTVFAYTDSEAFGGAEQALASLLTGLADSDEWRPTLLHSGGPGMEPLLRLVASVGIPDRVVTAMPEGPGGAAGAVRLARMLRVERPDVFHAHLTWPLGCKWALAAACAARVPAVLATAHAYVDIPIGLSRRLQIWALSRSVDRIIAVSDDTGRRFHASLGWPLARLMVIRNGIEADRFVRPPDPVAREELEDGSGRPIVLVPARLEAEKGHGDLLEAAQRLPGVRFVCVGDGTLREDLVGSADRLGVADRVTFLGFRDDVERLLGACDLVVLPSLFEGLPLALIEAMAAGKPVVATGLGGTPELVVEGETGLLVPARDPIALASAVDRVLGDPGLAGRLGSAGRQRALAHFTTGAMVDAVGREYERILGERRA
jgi:glycosyltransferase involved in cell wall biosynthesis